MPSVEDWKRILAQDNLTDAEVEEFVSTLRAFIGHFLDDYFRDEFEPDEL